VPDRARHFSTLTGIPFFAKTPPTPPPYFALNICNFVTKAKKQPQKALAVGYKLFHIFCNKIGMLQKVCNRNFRYKMLQKFVALLQCFKKMEVISNQYK
jgi:hypothetical protein